MSAFLVRRLVRLAVVITGVSLVTFAILHASGDPVSLIMPEAPEADRAVLRRTLGLHDPLPVQFARFVGNAVTGNFGKSFFHHGQSASALVLERMPTTLMLTVFSMGVALAIALPVGIYSAVRRGRAVDQLATGTVFAVPGVGRLIVGAIRQLDFPVVQAGVFMLAMIVVSVNFLVDVLYLYLNPQIRVR